jgi:hypothetical protein
MKIKPEEIDAHLGEIVEAWKSARQHAATLTEDGVRHAAEKIADQLRDDEVRDILASVFRAAKKGKKPKKK